MKTKRTKEAAGSFDTDAAMTELAVVVCGMIRQKCCACTRPLEAFQRENGVLVFSCHDCKDPKADITANLDEGNGGLS